MRKLQRRTRRTTRVRLNDPALQLTQERAPNATPLRETVTFEALAAAAQHTCATCEANPLEPLHPRRADPALALVAERSVRCVTAESAPDAALRWAAFQAAARDTCAGCPLERVREWCGACPLVAFLSTLAGGG